MVTPTPSWNTVRVHGTWVNQTGTRKTGTYVVEMPVRVTNAADDVIIPKGVFATGSLNTSTGSPSIDLQIPASDDPDNSPNGFQPTVTVTFLDAPGEIYVLDIPVALSGDPNGINLRQLVLSSSIPVPQSVLIRGVPGGLAELDSDGDVVDAAGDKLGTGLTDPAIAALIPNTGTATGAALSATYAPVSNANGRVTIYFDSIPGSDPTGATANDAAMATCNSLIPAAGGTVQFGTGTYAFAPTSAAAIVLQKSNVTYRGAGRDLTVLQRTSGTQSLVASTGTYIGLKGITIEDLTLDWNAPAFPSTVPNNQITARVLGAHVSGLRVRRVRLYRPPQFGFFCDGLTGFEFEDVEGVAPGDSRGGMMWFQNACSGTVTRPKSKWLYEGIRITTSTGSSSKNAEPAQKLKVIDFDVEGGWYMNLARSVKTGTVTYTATGITDTGASFPNTVGVSGEAADYIRVMPTLATGSGAAVTYGPTSLKDTAANFNIALVQEGQIIRAGGAFGAVANVSDDGLTIYVDEWWSDADRSRVSPPAAGAAYTVFNVILGRLNAWTSGTTLAVVKWVDLNGNSVTPTAGTYYEFLLPHGSYSGINGTYSSCDVDVINARVKRSYSDGVSTFGFRWNIVNPRVEWGETMGVAVAGDHHQVSNMFLRRNGGGGLWSGGSDSRFVGWSARDNCWLNMGGSPTQFGDVVHQGTDRNLFDNIDTEKTEAGIVLNDYGVVIGPLSGSCDSNTVGLIRSRGHSLGGLNIRSGATNTRVLHPGHFTETVPVVNNGTTTSFRGGDRVLSQSVTSAKTVTVVTAGTYAQMTGFSAITMPNDGATYEVALDAESFQTNTAGDVWVALGTSPNNRIGGVLRQGMAVGVAEPLSFRRFVTGTGQSMSLFANHSVSGATVTLNAAATPGTPIYLRVVRVG